MNATEIVAYIGAAAWVPQIITWIYKKFVIPKITIIPNKEVQIGYTTFGPILNLTLAFNCELKDAIIDKIDINIIHEDGSTHILTWQGMEESLGELSNHLGQSVVQKKYQPAIALKVSVLSLIEKFVLFQEKKFHDSQLPIFNKFYSHFLYLKETNDGFVDKSISSKEFHDLIDYYRTQFWWKCGTYTAEFKLSSPKRIKFDTCLFTFKLEQHHIDSLQKNIDNIRLNYEETIKTNIPDYESQRINWSWQNVSFTKSST